MPALDPVVQDALNRQYTAERQNAAIYAAIGNRFDALALAGCASFSRHNSVDKQIQADCFRDYIIARYGWPVVDALLAVDPPQADSLTAARVLFAYALMREQLATEAIKTIYDLAEDADDPQTCQFLLLFLSKQTESERKLSGLVARGQFAESCAAAVLLLDHELGE